MHPASSIDFSTETHEITALQREVVHLQDAVASHERIGFATGLLAYRFTCSPEQAWQLLVRLSQTTNVKLRRVAQILTDAHARRLDPGDEDLAAVLADLLSRRKRDLPVERPKMVGCGEH